MNTQVQTTDFPKLRLRIDEIDVLGGLVAGLLGPGVAVALRGDLGAGKSTLARSIIRALLRDDTVEVASPTFPIVVIYETPTFNLAHFDFYRLGGHDDVEETGYRDLLSEGAVLIEWPERAEDALPEDRLEISIDETDEVDVRCFTVVGTGVCAKAAARIGDIPAFLSDAGWARAQLAALHGDASSRRYFRLRLGDQRVGERRALLMDVPAQPDGPPIYGGKSYGEVAHIAENVRPFVAVDAALRRAGLSVPEIYSADLDRGLLLLEDLGDGVFGKLVLEGGDQDALWRAAVDALVHLRRTPVLERLPIEGAGHHNMPRYDRQALAAEVDLLLEWYWPQVKGSACPDAVRATFKAAWSELFERLLRLPSGWVLRDYHSPNLIWLPHRSGVEQVGVIDFQDALIGHPAYDLVSLLQDARVDVAEGIETRLIDRYITGAARQEASFNADDFRFAYAVLGAQRNTKILGIFARLAKRDHKPQYLAHLPRIWSYVERNLASPALKPLAEWYDTYLPSQDRQWTVNGH